MREGRWRWWRDRGSQRKRYFHAWMGWDKHSDILSHAMRAKNEYDSRNRTRTKKTDNYAHIHVLFTCSPSVSRHCWVSCASCWCFSGSWISRCHWCRTSHRSAGWFYTSTSFHHAYAIPSTKFFLLDVAVRLCPVIVNSICIQNSCIFHIAKMGLFEVLSYRAQAAFPAVKQFLQWPQVFYRDTKGLFFVFVFSIFFLFFFFYFLFLLFLHLLYHQVEEELDAGLHCLYFQCGMARVDLLHLHGVKRFNVDNACWKSERFLNGSVSCQTYWEWSTNFSCSGCILLLAYDRCDLVLQETSHARQTSSSR